METQIFNSYEEFLNREDKSINGVDRAFSLAHPEYYIEMNESNVGCWNCKDCANCRNCTYCIDCLNCTICKNCNGCSNCLDCTSCVNCKDCSGLYKVNVPTIPIEKRVNMKILKDTILFIDKTISKSKETMKEKSDNTQFDSGFNVGTSLMIKDLHSIRNRIDNYITLEEK